jgi:hypothetical protein
MEIHEEKKDVVSTKMEVENESSSIEPLPEYIEDPFSGKLFVRFIHFHARF